MNFLFTPFRAVLGSVRILFRDKEFRGLLILVGLILIIGTFFYAHFEHWSMLNALYFCVITLTTVGYGDFTPQTDAGKIFTIFYLIIGVGIILGFINVVAKHATKQYMRRTEAYLEQSEEFIEQVVAKILKKETGQRH